MNTYCCAPYTNKLFWTIWRQNNNGLIAKNASSLIRAMHVEVQQITHKKSQIQIKCHAFIIRFMIQHSLIFILMSLQLRVKDNFLAFSVRFRWLITPITVHIIIIVQLLLRFFLQFNKSCNKRHLMRLYYLYNIFHFIL